MYGRTILLVTTICIAIVCNAAPHSLRAYVKPVEAGKDLDLRTQVSADFQGILNSEGSNHLTNSSMLTVNITAGLDSLCQSTDNTNCGQPVHLIDVVVPDDDLEDCHDKGFLHHIIELIYARISIAGEDGEKTCYNICLLKHTIRAWFTRLPTPVPDPETDSGSSTPEHPCPLEGCPPLLVVPVVPRAIDLPEAKRDSEDTEYHPRPCPLDICGPFPIEPLPPLPPLPPLHARDDNHGPEQGNGGSVSPAPGGANFWVA